jgi:1-acylglycerone phosphate reductase
VSLEVTSAESIEAAKKEVEALTGGKLNILVNNAFVPLEFLSRQ